MEQSFNNVRVNDTTNLLTASWNNLFGDGGTSAIAIYANTICNTIVKPVALSLLSLVMIIQFLKITIKANNNDSIPVVREVILFMAVFMILYTVIQNADKIFIGIYDLINYIGSSMVEQKSQMVDLVFANDSETDLGKLLLMIIMGILCFIVSLIASAAAMMLCYGRGIQLYLYLAFSPIPLTLIGIDETKSYGIAFIRNFVAVCLSSCLMLFIFYCIPLLSSVMIDKSSNDLGMLVLNMFALSLLMIWSLIHCGGWAKEILGA